MSSKVNVVGIDVSARKLAVCVRYHNETEAFGEFDNDRKGHKKLLKFITKYKGEARICLEATGVYYFEAALFLHEASNAEVMVANPKAIHHFATALLQRAKTDKADAKVIVEYVRRMDFKRWEPPKENHLLLHRIMRRVHQVKALLAQEKSRLHASNYAGRAQKMLQRSINAVISNLEKEITKLEKEAAEIIQADNDLSYKFNKLISTTGIAQVAGLRLLGELIVLPPDMQSKQWVAFAGLDPRPVESGTSVNKPRRITKHGNKYLRSALYMPALVATQHSKSVKAYYNKLIDSGKKKIQALVAVMRKLLLCLWGMFEMEKLERK